MKRCYSCFAEYPEDYNVCPYCGAVENYFPKEPIYLYPGTVLFSRYIIGEAIGQGGFGIIYKAWDATLETVVAIKELFVSKLVTRAEGMPELIVSRKAQEEFNYRKKRFLAEARTMAKFGSHKNILNVFEYFEQNNTAYIVMELLEGVALNAYLAQVGGRIDPDFAVMIASEVGNALSSMHAQNIIHRDVAPDNIFICGGKDIRIKLLDFGAAKLSDETDDYIDIILKPGYSPVEQYDNTKNIGPWSDIYALGATLFCMVTGVKPEESTNRKQGDTLASPHSINPDVPEELSTAIMRAMAVERHLRFKNIEEFTKAIQGNVKVLSVAQEKKKRKTRRFSSLIAAVLVVAILTGVIGRIWGSKIETLKKATITVWCSVSEGSAEKAAMEEIIKRFKKSFPKVTVELTVYPEAEYAEAVAKAAADRSLPTLFESTGLPQSILEQASDLDNVVGSKQFDSCLFLGRYGEYYTDYKQIPLGIVVPVAEVIKAGPVKTDYQEAFFKSPSDFQTDAPMSASTDYEAVIKANFGEAEYLGKQAFLAAESPVYFTTTMEIYAPEIREMQMYLVAQVYPDTPEIYCAYTYEWSIGQGNDAEIAAAEKLLSWMLGNEYQTILMIGTANDGQIPINEATFFSKIEDKKLQPISEIYKRFVFIKNK